MKYELNTVEARVIGCLLEKSVTTPDYYPLTLNSLTTACNQKSNREPVMSLSEAEVLDAVESLTERRLVSDESGFNQRTSKYQHRFCNTEFGDLQLDDQELGFICCLLLRGAQTPGELRTRTNRMCSLSDVKEAESVLERLIEKGFVVSLPREAGKREIRYRQTFTPDDGNSSSGEAMHSLALDAEPGRLELLEQEVSDLRAELQALKEVVNRLIDSN
ncbi:hypothetical protein VA7868_03281 [Vibrio aerogenes CECT 7868]|uniref:Uncharacterized protein n=1 Tax=Vibrio aerogenes CECT 7868 TaxID=1216006 RepID=A0A1M5ZV08_9VIBR|nr:DUF480 domain-containing protein [Vibrio aerogenes]SHI28080.1 hypothetical protein VA7868_03281 [Vibrio aerogenes CECT 7868]